MPTLLLKTEPGEYSFADLQRDKRTTWSGVTNPAALKNLRAAARGDEAFVYHTGGEKRIVGLARIARAAYEDPARPGKTDAGEPRFAVVDLVPVREARSPLALAAMRADPRFASFDLLRVPRLSVVPVPERLDALIRALAGL